VPGQLRAATGLTAGFHGNTDRVTAPPTPGWPVQTLVLPPDPRSVGAARVFIQTHCAAAQLPNDTCDMAVLLTSEVVTNALLHGRSQVRLAVRIDQTGLTVQAGDDNSQHPQTTTTDLGALGGRGLSILASLATCWGVHDEPFGKIVWFRISTDTQDSGHLPTGCP